MRMLSLKELDRPGEHLWTVFGVLAVADPERPFEVAPLGGHLDPPGPGCVKCELDYSRRLARKPCTGSLS